MGRVDPPDTFQALGHTFLLLRQDEVQTPSIDDCGPYPVVCRAVPLCWSAQPLELLRTLFEPVELIVLDHAGVEFREHDPRWMHGEVQIVYQNEWEDLSLQQYREFLTGYIRATLLDRFPPPETILAGLPEECRRSLRLPE